MCTMAWDVKISGLMKFKFLLVGAGLNKQIM